MSTNDLKSASIAAIGAAAVAQMAEAADTEAVDKLIAGIKDKDEQPGSAQARSARRRQSLWLKQ